VRPAWALAVLAAAAVPAIAVAAGGTRIAPQAGLTIAAVGLALFARAPVDGTFLVDVLPSMILLGFGASAIGQLPQGYVQNEVHSGAYSERIATGRLATAKGCPLAGADRLSAETIERIMRESGIDTGSIGARAGSVAERIPPLSPRLYDMIFADV